MALKSTVFKADLQINDFDEQRYGSHALTVAQHPSETDERMMVRLLAFALNVPVDDHDGALEFAKGLSDTDEPDLWQRDLTGRIVQWIECGQPDERRLLRAAGRADRVVVFAYGSSTPIWWSGLKGRIARAANIAVWQVPAAQSQALGELVQRTMTLQINVQDGHVFVGDGERSVELSPTRLDATT